MVDAVTGRGCTEACCPGAVPCCDVERILSSFVISPQSKESLHGMGRITFGYGETSVVCSMSPQGAFTGWVGACLLALMVQKAWIHLPPVNVSSSAVGSG